MAAKTNDKTPTAAELSFEQALTRLEAIVEQLEGGQLPLEDSLARYEEGIRLSRQLTQALDAAEKRIERLVSEGGEPRTEPLELELGATEKGPEQEGIPF